MTMPKQGKQKKLVAQGHLAQTGESVGVSVEEHSFTESPIPTPEQLLRYKDVMSDLPERIVRQFEADSENIRALQHASISGDISFDRRSQWMAFVIIMVGLFGTFCLAYYDKDIAAIATGIGTAALIFRGTFSRKN